MSESQVVEAGFASKSDCLARYTPSEDTISVSIESSVGMLFGGEIRRSALEMLDLYGVETGRLEIEDDGALDLVIRARIEAVLRMAGFSRKTGFGVVSGANQTRAVLPQRGRRATAIEPGTSGSMCPEISHISQSMQTSTVRTCSSSTSRIPSPPSGSSKREYLYAACSK